MDATLSLFLHLISAVIDLRPILGEVPHLWHFPAIQAETGIKHVFPLIISLQYHLRPVLHIYLHCYRVGIVSHLYIGIFCRQGSNFNGDSFLHVMSPLIGWYSSVIQWSMSTVTRTGLQGFTLATTMRPGRIIVIKKHIIYEVVRPVGTLSVSIHIWFSGIS